MCGVKAVITAILGGVLPHPAQREDAAAAETHTVSMTDLCVNRWARKHSCPVSKQLGPHIPASLEHFYRTRLCTPSITGHTEVRKSTRTTMSCQSRQVWCQ
ncbi:hypothetical protein CHARACLAT_023864 [Characodon lateralis]|uniref:Secreted protein n=1 Tax=Characodon lateralis TaxID=208331 RepID=A0ABU7ECF1_9TELE|nr:hypothetical protein [Characodon lateralis]